MIMQTPFDFSLQHDTRAAVIVDGVLLVIVDASEKHAKTFEANVDQFRHSMWSITIQRPCRLYRGACMQLMVKTLRSH